MKRRRSRRSAWNWATTGSIDYTDNSASVAPVGVSGPLLPAARVEWLLEEGRGRDSLVVTGILLWLDFVWQGPLSESGIVYGNMLPVDFYVLKRTVGAANESVDYSGVYTPYASPAVPSSVTDWFGTSAPNESDGLDPYLWTHHLSEYVAGTAISIYQQDGNGWVSAINTNPSIGTAGTVQPVGNVRAAWQPDVHIKSKRKLARNDELLIGFTLPEGANNGITYNLAYHARVLTT